MKWALKIVVKMVLSRAPVGYSLWRRLGAFKHGHMHSAHYAINVIETHINRMGGVDKILGATCLELGPGDSLASALIARAYGAEKVYMVDAGSFIDRKMAVYHHLAELLRAAGLKCPDIADCQNVDQMLVKLNASYLTQGLSSLKSIETSSIDLIWSQAVLEHVRLSEVDQTFLELRRIIRPSGCMSHRIDYKDHLDASLNNLRFSEKLWETEFMAKSGFYTNRIRQSEMLNIIERSGFKTEIINVDKWRTLPIERKRMNNKFSSLHEEDLIISGSDLLSFPIN